MLVTNLSIPGFLENGFILLSLLKNIFPGYGFLGWQVIFFQHL